VLFAANTMLPTELSSSPYISYGLRLREALPRVAGIVRDLLAGSISVFNLPLFYALAVTISLRMLHKNPQHVH